MTYLLLTAAVIMAEAKDAPVKPNARQLELLKIFRKEFIHITPGKGKFPAEFTMGTADEQKTATPAHKVKLSGDFHVACYEVPQNLWEAVMGKNPSRWKGKRNSVEMLSFDEAVDFCRKTTSLMRAAKLITVKQSVRLPSEAEWEYTARAGTKTRYSFGDDVEKLDAYGWHTGNAAGNDPEVGQKKPNAWGLYDVHGYLWEWCADPWHATYRGAPATDSTWNKDGDEIYRVARGGSWRDKAAMLTSSYRIALDHKTRGPHIGLRCVLK